mmetsp:Transcript_64637/g.140752  ORF Transcript_64637/g.140752 Transcript_64637/m.140752 type:complete len:406 (-) Transcript_64637:243-1460(-)|eukprot:CAMPEP_0170600010 /NCGR_PEP_ID=MMETSP0224-20130122/17108_1 /TAXON_ID=285029 /ORGANISM="Togula jolla, Strain CCCM 725" /LENGTH=405 /DNA_ID=CAMNT_0010924711 /DNA_START=81 /DNA_END=1298 /DNA_ORIENTATION=-
MAATEAKKEATAQDAFMCAAAASALAGVRIEHGGPFGAAIVRDGVIISCAHNMVLHRSDPTCHAEMNAIQQACQALRTHDLSDCELYTTCEPCPMCWGAVQWCRLGKAHIGVDRHTAAKYGFDDKIFYDEIDTQSGHYGIQRYGYILDSRAENPHLEKKRVQKNMVEIWDGVCHNEVASLFTDPNMNRTLRRRYTTTEIKKSLSSKQLSEEHKPMRCLPVDPEDDEEELKPFKKGSDSSPDVDTKQHEHFMHLAIRAAAHGIRDGKSKEREPFGAIIVKDGIVIAEAHNNVLDSRDATATAEVSVIRAAAARLGTHNLEGCSIYSTAHPDLMSLGAILWARISCVYCGVTQKFAEKCGFEEGMLHFKDLLEVKGNDRVTEVVEGVAVDDCEAVFKEWSDRNGVIY